MPGPAMHHMIADRLRQRVLVNAGLGPNIRMEDYASLQSLLGKPRNMPYLFLGCQGPDFFFFNAKDIHPTIGKMVELYYDVYDFIERFKRTLLDAVPKPVLDALEAYDEFKNEVIQDSALLSELQQTFDDLNRLLSGFMATLSEMVKKYISEFNVFNLVSHPYRDGAGAGDWWWFDVMHYRKTGQYAGALLEATRDISSPLHLYALGYLTHVAADTVGHPYVNINSGGPYRSQAQRHKTGENYQDVYNLLNVTGMDWNYSKLHALYNFNYNGVISDSEPDDYTNMPGALANLLAQTLNAVYKEMPGPSGAYAPHISAETINDTYRTWYRWFRSATDTGTLPPPVPYSFTGELREVWDKTVDNLEDAGQLIKNAIDSAGSFGVLSIFLILAAAVVAAVMAAAALADGIAGALATVGTATIRYAACLIYEQLYDAFQNFRLGVALNGLAFPMREHLSEPRFLQFINPSIPDSTGATALTIAQRLPLQRWSTSFLNNPLGVIFSQERHLYYPITSGERVSVWPGPHRYFTEPATYYAFGDIRFDPHLLEELHALASGGDLTEDTLRKQVVDRTLGNAVVLSGAMYAHWYQGQVLPDFNLDADRGYGYLCWTQTGDPPNQPTALQPRPDANGNPRIDLQVLPQA